MNLFSNSDQGSLQPSASTLNSNNFLIFNLDDYANFTSHNDWFLFAEQRPNDKYLALVVTALTEAFNLSHTPGETEIHHIIPRSVGGQDTPWNRVLVTLKMHQELHRTRYAVYGNHNDGLTIRFRDGDPTRYMERAKLSHLSQMRQKKVSVWVTHVFSQKKEKTVQQKGSNKS